MNVKILIADLYAVIALVENPEDATEVLLEIIEKLQWELSFELYEEKLQGEKNDKKKK